jgi:hypothetical protein
MGTRLCESPFSELISGEFLICDFPPRDKGEVGELPPMEVVVKRFINPPWSVPYPNLQESSVKWR